MIGESGHARVAIDVFREQYPRELIEGLIAEDASHVGLSVDSVPVIGTDDDLQQLHENGVTHAFVGIGDNRRRKFVIDVLSKIGYFFPVLIHPHSLISKSAEIGAGTLVVAGAVVNAGSRIGMHTIINTQSSVDHDCVIGDFVHISPGVHLAGNTTILEGTHVGIGTVTIPGVTVGSWSMIGAGSTIVRNIDSDQLAFGTPCRPVQRLAKKNDELIG